MKKRILSAVLAPMLLFSMAVPGIAAESGSADRLAAVTRKVKDTLDLDTGRYKDFNGQLTEGELAPTWRLSWSGEGDSLEITASESGKILSYYRYSEDDSRDSVPLSFPKSDPTKAETSAAAFLKRVLDSKETVDLGVAADQSNSLRQTRYYFRGTILLNGCPSPLSFSLVVNTSDYAVVQFRRDALETDYIGTAPAANFRVRQNTAASLLQSTLSMRLEYVLDEGEQTAVLRYLPNPIDSFYVDDASGKLVNLTELYEELEKGSDNRDESAADSAPMSPAGGSNSGLTQAEQLGADKLKGTLSREALDQRARAIVQLGLDGYTLTSVSYREGDNSIIIARLYYAKRVEDETFHRTVTLNAKTGTLMEVYSSRPWSRDDSGPVTEDAARETAESFLAAQQGEHFSRCADYGDSLGRENGRCGSWSFQYARQENGYFFPNDRLIIEIDAVDGSVSFYSHTWSEDIRFDSPDGVIPMEQAVGAYFKTFQVTKGYVAVPQKLDLSNPDYAPLTELGYQALNSLKLGWQLTAQEKTVTGIDAKTGLPVLWNSRADTAVKYGDLAGSPAKQAAEALAGYGIGYAGGSLRPDKKLTQLDLVALLASTQGILIDPENPAEGDADQAYRAAYGMGVLRREERNDNQLLSQMDVIKFLLDAGATGPPPAFRASTGQALPMNLKFRQICLATPRWPRP